MLVYNLSFGYMRPRTSDMHTTGCRALTDMHTYTLLIPCRRPANPGFAGHEDAYSRQAPER